MRDTLLIIEDEELFSAELARHLEHARWRVERACSLEEARARLDTSEPLVVISDMSLPDGNALDLLEQRQADLAEQPAEWIFLTGYGTVPDSVRALRLGAFDFLEKPCALERLDLAIAGAARSARAQRRLSDRANRANRRYTIDAFLGESRPAREVRGLLRKLSSLRLTTLLIQGETGTGKGLVARILHHNGERAGGPLVEVNCAAFSHDLMDSELFGHEAGAFTGAQGRHRGLFEQARGGTLFLDEVGELAPGLQAKLLKAVEDHRIRRVGGEREIEIDVQVFAATNRRLPEATGTSGFREDLLHRLSVFVLELPPLRDRISDLEQLVPAAVAEFDVQAGKHVTEIPAGVWERLASYAWPGNVRELRNVVERSVLLSPSGALDERWLQLRPAPPAADGESMSRPSISIPLDGGLSLDEMEALIIRESLKLHGHNVSAAARALGTTRQTLRYRIEKHGIGIGGAETSV